MNHFDHFIEDTTKSIAMNETNKHTVKNKLPSSKRILIQLNKFSVYYPDIHLLLRTNLWRICINPSYTLSSFLPLDVWNHIDMYLCEERLNVFILKCKKQHVTRFTNYIINSTQQLKFKLKNSNSTGYEKWDLIHKINQLMEMKKWLHKYSMEYYIN